MLYPVYVHLGDEATAHGVTIPDFPGCFAAADEWQGLPGAVQDAVEAHFHGEPNAVPAPSAVEDLARSPDYQGGVWMLVDIDLAKIESRPVRLNISLPEHVVKRIDAWAEQRGMTRSGFLAQAALGAMERDSTVNPG